MKYFFAALAATSFVVPSAQAATQMFTASGAEDDNGVFLLFPKFDTSLGTYLSGSVDISASAVLKFVYTQNCAPGSNLCEGTTSFSGEMITTLDGDFKGREFSIHSASCSMPGDSCTSTGEVVARYSKSFGISELEATGPGLLGSEDMLTLFLGFGGEGAPIDGGIGVRAISHEYTVDVQYNYDPAPKVPLPATLPLLFSGLGLFGWIAGRKRVN